MLMLQSVHPVPSRENDSRKVMMDVTNSESHALSYFLYCSLDFLTKQSKLMFFCLLFAFVLNLKKIVKFKANCLE